MDKKTLLPSQRNEVFRLILDNEFDPSDFAWDEIEGRYRTEMVSRIIHKRSSYYYIFDVGKGKNRVSECSPGEETRIEIADASSWAVQADHFNNWLGDVKRELEAPDLWASISGEAKIIEAASELETGNAFFTEAEKRVVLSGLTEIKQYLLTAHKLDSELIEPRLNYLIEASDRVGKKDWINILISTLVGIVITAALPPEVTRELFRFAGTVLRQILSNQLLLP